MRRFKLKKTSILGIVIVLLIFIGGAAGGLFMMKTMQASYDMQIEELETQISRNTYVIYVAASDIKCGDAITEDVVKEEVHLLSYPSEIFTKEQIGTVAKMSIPEGTMLMAAMCEDEKKEITEREVEFTCFYVSKNVEVGDYIDVRIRYQTGEDYVILPKKRVERLSLTNATCFLMVNEVELQLMASAIVDVSEHDAVLYTSIYPQPELQDKPERTYPARKETNELLINLSEVLDVVYEDSSEARVALEERIAGREESNALVIDISNLKEYEESDISNTNGDGTDITSDYESEQNNTEKQEETIQ